MGLLNKAQKGAYDNAMNTIADLFDDNHVYVPTVGNIRKSKADFLVLVGSEVHELTKKIIGLAVDEMCDDCDRCQERKVEIHGGPVTKSKHLSAPMALDLRIPEETDVDPAIKKRIADALAKVDQAGFLETAAALGARIDVGRDKFPYNIPACSACGSRGLRIDGEICPQCEEFPAAAKAFPELAAADAVHQYRPPVTCPICQGSGKFSGVVGDVWQESECPECQGSGEVTPPNSFFDHVKHPSTRTVKDAGGGVMVRSPELTPEVEEFADAIISDGIPVILGLERKPGESLEDFNRRIPGSVRRKGGVIFDRSDFKIGDKCPTCQGRRHVTTNVPSPLNPDLRASRTDTCPECRGTGAVKPKGDPVKETQWGPL